ncbi:MAG TPA: DUF559 domain-containing protein [Bradyrhizobium sp.]|nr:DUF559 domain-containing protein [Bradyrhizobium sp.]
MPLSLTRERVRERVHSVHPKHNSDAVGPHDGALRKAQTDAEGRLWTHLRAGRLDGLKFRRQFPAATSVVDFCCRKSRPIVETDGAHHAAQSQAEPRRDQVFSARIYRALRFWNNDVLSNIEGMNERIRQHCASGENPLPCPLPGQDERARTGRTGQRKAAAGQPTYADS